MSKIDKLNSLREKVRSYDMEILDLFEKRYETCKEISKEKKVLGIEIFQPSVEENLKKLWFSKKNKFLTENFLNKLFELTTEQSRNLQSEKQLNLTKILN